MAHEIRSYTSVQGSGPGAMREFTQLLSGSLRSAARSADAVANLLRITRAAEAAVFEQTGLRIEGLKVLEVGTGQLPRQTAYFAARNDVTGIDLDVVPMGFDVASYFKLLRTNGIRRTLKTIGRKLLGFDRRFNRELCRQLGVNRVPRAKLLQMDATKLAFAPASFDFAYSFDVFEHLPDPAAVLREMVRVLKPGGVALSYVHPYTNDSGNHDLRITMGKRDDVPRWAHLRPAHAGKVQNFAYLNRLRLREWQAVFEAAMPGAHVNLWKETDPALPTALTELRAKGELAEYADEELLTHRIVAIWQKPGAT